MKAENQEYYHTCYIYPCMYNTRERETLLDIRFITLNHNRKPRGISRTRGILTITVSGDVSRYPNIQMFIIFVKG